MTSGAALRRCRLGSRSKLCKVERVGYTPPKTFGADLLAPSAICSVIVFGEPDPPLPHRRRWNALSSTRWTHMRLCRQIYLRLWRSLCHRLRRSRVTLGCRWNALSSTRWLYMRLCRQIYLRLWRSGCHRLEDKPIHLSVRMDR